MERFGLIKIIIKLSINEKHFDLNYLSWAKWYTRFSIYLAMWRL